MYIESPAFEQNQTIPEIYTAVAENVSPPLIFRDPPAETITFAIIVDDPDAPGGTFVHWVAWNLPGDQHHLPEGEKPPGEGKNDYGNISYGGPRPPRGKPHRYFFKVYALDSKLNLSQGSSKKQLEKAMEGHVLAEAELIGIYQTF